MTSHSTRSADFDARMRATHQAGLRAMPAPTLARLRAARRHASRTQAAPTRRRGWLLAALPMLLGAALGLHLLLRHPPSVPASTTATTPARAGTAADSAADDDQAATALLDENPDLYLWLGSDTSLAME